MRHQFRRLHARLRLIFFGPAYHPANHDALNPRGSIKEIRLVLITIGTLWLGLVLFDNLARPWQRRPKSWQYFQGPRELNEAPNQPRQRDFTRTSGALGHDLGVASIARLCASGEDTTAVYCETDEEGFRTVQSRAPFMAALCGDSFSNNNSFADSLARATGLTVGNRAIEGRGTLTMARYLEERPQAYRHAKLVVWEITQRTGVADFTKLVERRQLLRRPNGFRWQWQQSLLWPMNMEIYLKGSSLLQPLLDNAQKAVKWALLKKHTDLIVVGRRDLPPGAAPMLYLGIDEAIRPNASTQLQLDSIASYVADINLELKTRGQQLVFLIAPEKSVVYPDRLPMGLIPRTNYLTGLHQALKKRGVHVVDVCSGLRQAAASQPRSLYYYTGDSHWTPRGMALASRIVADSLERWGLISRKSAGQ